MASASSVPTGGAMIHDSISDTGIALSGESMHSEATTIPSSLYIGSGGGGLGVGQMASHNSAYDTLASIATSIPPPTPNTTIASNLPDSPLAISHVMSESATYDEFLSAVSQQSDMSDTSMECDDTDDIADSHHVTRGLVSRGVKKPLPSIPPNFCAPPPPPGPKSLISPIPSVVERKLTILERRRLKTAGASASSAHKTDARHDDSERSTFPEPVGTPSPPPSAHATVAATLAKRNNSLRRMATLNRIHLMQRQPSSSSLLPATSSSLLDSNPPALAESTAAAAVLPPPTLSVVASLTRTGTARRLVRAASGKKPSADSSHVRDTTQPTIGGTLQRAFSLKRSQSDSNFSTTTAAAPLSFPAPSLARSISLSSSLRRPPQQPQPVSLARSLSRTGSMKHSRPALTLGRRARAGANEAGGTLDKHGFIALQDIVATVVRNPGLVLSDEALADDDDDGGDGPRIAMATEGGPLVTMLDPTVAAAAACPPAYRSTASSSSISSSAADKTTLPSSTDTHFCDSLGRAAAAGDAGGQVMLTKAQWKELAPTLAAQGQHVHAMVGARTLASGEVEVDLDTFLPLVSLLQPSATGTLPRYRDDDDDDEDDEGRCNSMHTAKLALLYAIMDTEGTEHVTHATLNRFLSGAIKANGLCIVDSADHARLVDTVMRALDVDGDGNVSFHDFLLVTRKWDLTRVGLPLKRAAVNRGVDMRRMEYTAGDAEVKVGEAGEGWGSLRRKSTVRSAGGWMAKQRRSRVLFNVPGQAQENGDRPGDDGHSAGRQQTKKPTWAHWMHVYLSSQGSNLVCILLFSLLVFGMATHTYLTYAKSPLIQTYMPYCVPIAKFCACIINLSTTFLFLLMCRTLLTYVRSVPYLGKWTPINKHIVWHRYIGMLWVVAGLVHGVCHLLGSIPTIVREPEVRKALKLPLATDPGGDALTYTYLAFFSIPGWTGWLLTLISVLMAVTSSNAARRAHFERFFYTHHLFIAAVVLLLLHGSAQLVAPASSWKYIVVPTAVYTCERLARVHRSSFKVQVVEASVQADTLVLVMSKPPFLRSGYLAGQYVFINVPAISMWQWHPFSVTSCGEDECVSVRIKRVGDWTRDLFAVVEPLIGEDEDDEETASVGTTSDAGLPRPPQATAAGTGKRKQHHEAIDIPPPTPTMMRNPSAFTMTHQRPSVPKSLADLDIRLDGVFGAPSQSFFEYQQAMFIGTGIGCTPFLSILQRLKALVHAKRARRRRTTMAVSSLEYLDPTGRRLSTHTSDEPELTRIDFFWLNRDQAGFKWMAETLRNLDPEVRSLLRVHTFLTCAKGGEELASFMLWWGLELVKHAGGGGEQRCLLTGIQDSSVYWGRPDWKSIFEQTAEMFPGQKVGVFFCGTKALSKELAHVVREANLEGRTVFEFVKENF